MFDGTTFIKNHNYFFFTFYDYSSIKNIDQELFNAFKPCRFIERKPNNAGVYKNYFEVENWDNGIIDLGIFESTQNIYKDEDHILRTLLKFYEHVKHSNDPDISANRVIRIDEFMKNKIKISQEKFPEKWI